MREPSERSSERVPSRIVRAPASEFRVVYETIDYDTAHALQFIDITADVRRFVTAAEIVDGQVAVVSLHTTAAVVVNEHEPLLLNDMARVLRRLAPADDYYEHNDFSIRTVNMTADERENGHAHCQHLFLGTSETIPIRAGELTLGLWQSVFLVELDHARRRTVQLHAMGVAGA